MLKATELRIGNYILSWEDGNQGNPVKVTAANLETLSKVGPHQEYMALKPIPLTPELLEKCGFEKEEGYDRSTNNGDLTLTGAWLRMANGSIYYSNGKGYCVEGLFISSGLGAPEDYAFKAKKIEYLHQLQNLYFALAGEELSVNL